MSVLRNYLHKQLGKEFDVLGPKLKAVVDDDSSSDRVYTLDLVLKDGNLTLSSITALRFLQNVLKYTSGDLNTCSWILEDLEIKNVRGLAFVLYPRSHLDSGTEQKVTTQAIEEIRSKIFEDHQLLVMLALLQGKKFNLSGSQREVAESILSTIVQDNIHVIDPDLVKKVMLVFSKNNGGKELLQQSLMEGLNFAKSITLLCRVVEDPEDVPLLHNAGFESVRQITQQLKGDFSSQMLAVGMKSDNALKVHDCSERVDCWNEQLWLSLMQSRRHDFIPISTTRPQGINVGEPSGRPLNNLTNLFKLEDTACEECCSVTSLSAYLTDLLLLLSNTKFPVSDRPSLETLGDENNPKNLLQVLFSRRPDIRKLQLTCANSQTLLPYISLVNEVLESYIRSIATRPIAPSDRLKDSIRAYQTPHDLSQEEGGFVSAADSQYRPANTDYAVYRKLISEAGHPFPHFPYDLSRDIEVSVFSTLGLDFVQFIRLFQLPENILNLVTGDRRGQPGEEIFDTLVSGANETLQRQLAAETIGLQQTDFAAVTSETFFPNALADLVNGLSPIPLKIDKACLVETSALWGFDDDDEMLNPDRGLSIIKSQFMPKSGLEFQDVLNLIKTRCFGQHLVITNSSGSQQFGTFIEDLRLLSNASAPPFQPLNEKLAFNLQAFLRLRAKLKWSIHDLDAAVASFRNLELSSLANVRRAARSLHPISDANLEKSKEPSLLRPKDEWEVNPSEVVSISPFVIKGIASLVRLSKLSGSEPYKLLPLWVPIDTFGDNSLFHREFAVRRFQQIDEIFSMHSDKEAGSGQYLTVDGLQVNIGDHSRSICAALGWPTAHFDQLLLAADCQHKKLDIDTFSTLYRHAMICHILSVPPKNCMAFFSAFYAQSGSSILSDPVSTVTAIEEWKLLLDKGWDIELLNNAFEAGKMGSENSTKEENQEGLRLALDIAAGASKLTHSIPFTLPGAVINSADIVDCASRVFDASTAKAVVGFIEDSTELDKKLITKFGLLQELSEAIKELEKPMAGTAPETTQTTPPQPSTDKTPGGDQGAKDADSTSAEAARLATEKKNLEPIIQLRNRRAIFIRLATPKITEDLTRTFLVQTVKELLPETGPPVILTLLSDLISVPKLSGQSEESALSALEDLKQPANDALTAKNLDAYFSPPSSDKFTLSYSVPLGGDTGVPTLSIDNLEVPYDSASSSFTTFRLVSGKSYHLRANFSAQDVTWSTPKSGSNPFTEGVLTSASIASRAASILKGIRRVAQACTAGGLTPEELQYIALNRQKTGENLVMDLNKASLTDLVHLTKYNELRKVASRGSKSLIGLLVWLSITTSPSDSNTLATRFSEATGWNQGRIYDALANIFPDLSSEEVVKKLRDFKTFLKFTDIMIFNDDLENACAGGGLPSMSVLFELAKARHSLSVKERDFQRALELQDGLTPSQKNNLDATLSERRRSVLVEYLLQQEIVRDDLKISDADGLFKLLLIDVQMGPHLRTSRIKQAISVVQLFVQRCLLGMEDDVPKTMLAREKWSWMQHYNIWEAHRKMFLYPENWLEPSLRDDKSQLFEQLEAALMQKDLSMSTFLRAIQDYTYSMNDVASLDIVSYLHEPRNGDEDRFHIFGRTRVAPHTFYYRTLTIYHVDDSVFWQPWMKMEVDIPSVESDWDLKRLKDSGSYLMPVLQENRLYIFFPQLMVKMVNANPQPTLASGEKVKTWTDMGRANVSGQEPMTSWEITMAWSEYVKGTWAPKRVSPGSLSIEELGASVSTQELLSAWGFRIDPIFEANRFRLVISHASGKDLTGKVIGSFDFSRDQITAVQDGNIDIPKSQFATYFGKVQGANSALFIPGTKDDKTKPLVWIPNGVKRPKENIQWTLSKAPERLTGLVLNVKQDDGSSISYFNVPEKSLLRTEWSQEVINSRMALMSMDHSFSQKLMQGAVDRVNPLQTIYTTMSAIPARQLADSFGLVGGDTFYHELASPCALYNWELGLHSIMLAADRFLSTQQFDEALQIIRLLFDPTIDVGVQPRDDKWTTTTSQPKSCWRFPPFQDISEHIDMFGDKSPSLNKLASELHLAIKDRRLYGQLVHAAARGRPQAYMKWVVMKYAEILLAAGDEYFRQGTLETLPLAIQRYIEASHVLGPEPPKGLKLSKRTPLCFEDVLQDEVRFNLDLPFSAQLKRDKGKGNGSASSAENDPKKEAVRSFIMTSYFCVPLNPKFKTLRRLAYTRLFNIRNSLDINGNPVVYALREPPIDPGALVALSGGGSVSNDMAMAMAMVDQNGPLPRYRFEMRLTRAFELCNELRSLVERFLSAVEKKEVEELNALHAHNATIIQNLMVGIKQTQLLEAKQTLESLKMNREAQVSQLSFFLESIGEPISLIPSPTGDWTDLKQDIGAITKDDLRMSEYEQAEMDLSSTAASLNIIAAGIDSTAQMYAWMPNISGNVAPLGVGTSISAGGPNIAGAIQIAATCMKANAMNISDSAAQAGRKARMARQLQERRLQANIRGREIKAMDRQIEIQKIRIGTSEKEIESQKASMEDAAQAESYYRTKYTNQQLYAWMEKGLRDLCFQAYAHGITAAQQAQAALSFEQGRRVSILRPTGYWNASHDGLLAAENLYLDLKRLESAHIEGIRTDYQITKTFSLRQIDPLAFLRLRDTGSTDFCLTELQYDVDFPGHYMRRIRSVAVSLPAVIGPYTGVSATLTLTKHEYRVNSTAVTAKDYMSTDAESFRTDRVPISSVALSSGFNDAGVFELNFANSKYLPFEGAGAISSWNLRLPTEIRKFDYETIGDVLLHIQYTSLEGGECLRAAANEAVRLTAQSIKAQGESQGFYAMLDLKNDFANAWYAFSSNLRSSYKATGNATATMELGDIRNHLSFWSKVQPTLIVKSITLVSRSAKLVRSISMPAATGDEPTIDDGQLSEDKSSFTKRIFSGLCQQNLSGWALEVSGAVTAANEEVENVYMLIQYVFG